MIILAIFASLFCIVGNTLDIAFSEKAFSHGAIEGSEEIRELLGQRPATWKLSLFNLALLAPGVVAVTCDNPAVYGAGVGWLIFGGIRHYIGFFKARSWIKANVNG